MEPPPRSLDGARVVAYADVSDVEPTGRTRHYVDGALASGFTALAIARYDPEGEVYLLYCDDKWNVVTDTRHDTVEAARDHAGFEFGRISFTQAPGADGRSGVL